MDATHKNNMELTHNTLLSMADLERLTGVTFKPIQKRLAKLEPAEVKGSKKLYCSKKALPLVLRVAADKGALDLSQERAKLARAQTEKIEIEIKKQLEQLVDKDEFMEDFEKSFASLKESLLQLGDSVAQEILDTGAKNKDTVANIIEDRIHSFLEDVANEHEAQ